MKSEHGDPNETLVEVISSETGGICTGFVLVATFMGEDGDRRIYCDTMRGQLCHESMGLLSWGLAIEQRRAQLTWEEDD